MVHKMWFWNLNENLKDEYGQKLIFHVFSNAGANTYSTLIKEINQYNSGIVAQPINVAGVVFDSCPSRPSFFAGVRAWTVSKHQLSRLFIDPLFCKFFYK